MFQQIAYIFFKLKLIQPSKSTIERWKQANNVHKLEDALKEGNYKTRLFAAEALSDVGQESSIPILFNSIDDKVQNVSIAALNALDKIGCDDELGSIIINKRFNWMKKKREREEELMANKRKKYNIYRWERASKKSFDRVKEQLKRPMR